MFFCRGPLEDNAKVSNFFNATFETTDLEVALRNLRALFDFKSTICVLLIIDTLSLLW